MPNDRPDSPPTSATLSLGLLLTLALAAFSPCLWNGFVWDDVLIVLPVDAYWAFDLGAMVFHRANALEYLPVRDVTLALDAALWGRNPFGFHLGNLLCHLGGTAACYFAARRLLTTAGSRAARAVAFWTALFYAVHPLQAEAVNFISARNTLLAALFVFLSLRSFLTASAGRPVQHLAGLVFFVLACWSKASAVFLPLFLLLLALILPDLRQRLRGPLGAILGVYLAVAATAGVTHLLNARQSGLANPDVLRFGNDNIALGLGRAVMVPWFYLAKVLVPAGLSTHYTSDLDPGPLGLWPALAAAGLAAMVLGAWVLRRRSLVPLLSIAWTLLSLVPVLNLFPTNPVFADRYATPMLFGPALLFGWGVDSGWRRHRLVRAAAVLALAGMMATGFARSLDWRSDLTLFSSAFASNPDEARESYGSALFAAGRTDRAFAVLQAGPVPNWRLPYLQGTLHLRAERYNEALPHLRRAAELGGDARREVHIALAVALEGAGRAPEALEHYLEAIEARSVDPLDRLLQQAERGADRVREAMRPQIDRLALVAAERPRDPAARAAYGSMLYATGMYEEALAEYRATADLAPERWASWYNLGLAYGKLGRHREAINAFGRAARLNPEHAHTWNHIGIQSAAVGDGGRAVEAYRRALETDPSHTMAAFNLGRLLYRRGDREGAAESLALARTLAGEGSALSSRIEGMLHQMGE